MVLAEWTGLEPATPGVTGRYSNQLNYHSRSLGSETATGGFVEHPATRLANDAGRWWVLTGSNRRHSPCKGDALPAELSTRTRDATASFRIARAGGEPYATRTPRSTLV